MSQTRVSPAPAATELITVSAPLRASTPGTWIAAVLANFDRFLQDHAANERKASAMAMSMVAHYPDRPALVDALVDLALEELNHFRQVLRLMNQRGVTLCADEKDPYVNTILRHVSKEPDEYFLDRLLTAAVIEARGAERFALLAAADLAPDTQTFYRTLARSEANHHQLFIRLAHLYFPAEAVAGRLDYWLEIEAAAMLSLEPRPRLH